MLDNKEVAFAFEQCFTPYIEASHHLQVSSDLIELLIMVIKVLGSDAEKVITITFGKAVEKHAIKVPIQLRSYIFH